MKLKIICVTLAALCLCSCEGPKSRYMDRETMLMLIEMGVKSGMSRREATLLVLQNQLSDIRAPTNPIERPTWTPAAVPVIYPTGSDSAGQMRTMDQRIMNIEDAQQRQSYGGRGYKPSRGRY